MVSAALAAAPAAAGAETAPTSSVSEVIVTALKRETSAQSTPMSITALSGEAIKASGVEDVSALTAVPGLAISNAGPSNTRVIIRGIQAVGEATVGVYYDETPVTGMVGATNDAGGNTPALKLFDVARVEVLRGPQGTLYGSGAMSGALRVIFNKPTPKLEGAIDGRFSGTDRGTGDAVQAMVNLPVIADRFAVRAVAFNEDSGGFINNPVLRLKDVDSQHVQGGRLLARLWANAHLTIDGSINYQKTRGDRPIWVLEDGTYNANHRSRLPSEETLTVYNLTARWDLGPVIATGVASYEDRNLVQAVADPSYFFQSDINNAAVCARLRGGGRPCSAGTQAAFNAYVQGYVHGVLMWGQDASQPSYEFRLTSSGQHRLDWTVGAFYSKRSGTVNISQFATDAASGAISQPPRAESTRLVDDRLGQAAVFADAAYKITRKLTVDVGSRYYDYDRRVAGATTLGLDLINAHPSAFTAVKSTDSGWVSKVDASYQVTDSALAYFQAAQGFRPGGVNQVLGLPAVLGPYRSDSLWSYEAGVKTAWMGGRMTLNIDGYHTDWNDMQVTGSTPSGPFQFISNAGAAVIDGGEAELAFTPLQGLRIEANAAYADARLSQDQRNANIIATGRRGDRIPYVPQLTGAASAEYDWPLSGRLRGVVRADAHFIGESFSEFRPTNSFYRRLPAYTLVHLKLGAESKAGRWGGYLFVDNLLDEVALTWASANGVTTGRTTVTSAPPRTIGVNLHRAF